MARNLKRRGYLASDSVNVLIAPGSLKNAPTVAQGENGLSVAEISAIPNLVGQVAETPDPQTEVRLEQVRATTKPSAVAPKAMNLNVGMQGDAAAVIESRAPNAAKRLAEDKQVPSLSLFKKR